MRIVLLVVLCAVPVRAASLLAEHAVLSKALAEGDWNARISAVNTLGEAGVQALPDLVPALADLDWQVRLTAVHRVGAMGEPALGPLVDLLQQERCGLVRLAALNWVGQLAPQSDVASVDAPEDVCESWFWPSDGRRRVMRKASRGHTRAFSMADESGCRYVRYDRPGRRVCPRNMRVEGVGATPGSIDFLERPPPLGGVALCCPQESDGPPPPPEAAVAPKSVECRLVPLECPGGWLEMALPDRERTRKLNAHRRNHRHRRGATTWIHCCRPTTTNAGGKPEEGSLPPDSSHVMLQRELDAREEEVEPVEYYEEEEERLEVRGMPEREIARKALAKRVREPENLARPAGIPPHRLPAAPPAQSVQVDTRRAQLNSIMAWLDKEDALPRPAAIPQRSITDPDAILTPDFPDNYQPPPTLRGPDGPTETLERPTGIDSREPLVIRAAAEREAARRAAESPTLNKRATPLGKPEARLARPTGATRRSAGVTAKAELMADAGTLMRDDALPELLRQTKSRNIRKRARAAEMIGHLGPQANKAVPRLRRLLKDKQPRVRSSAALALGAVTRGSDIAIKDLKKTLRDKHVDVRYSAAQALGRIGTPAARKVFHRYMGRLSRQQINQEKR
jgi:hypothetical protein